MKEIIRIVVSLTISCLVAAFVMGTVFAITDKAKKHNEHLNVQETVLGLLGYSKANPAPSDLRLFTMYRYILEDDKTKNLGYMVPIAGEDKEGYELLIINLKGEFIERLSLDIPPEKAAEEPERKAALMAVIEPPKIFTYADSTIIAKLGGKRLAYLLPGEFPGFKTFIEVMLALDPTFKIMGLEIMEHEEDPGLGGEIEQEYFKNQFKDKSFEKVKELKVVKEPLPDEYFRYLEADKTKEGLISREDIEEIKSKYQDKDIYALTGATISSRSVTVGVKNIIKKFAYRVNILDRVIAGQNIPVAF
ncbi:MAG: FMN-binding protein [Deltaproteobacteria bacterium]|nr:FMN-binding protein [Deltaproteobacteria bacterium]MBW2116974.1 FMN-binding protein [Deltaproteobacteria bacterium]MBW2344219.1 FMN-binding protein [Deltaproteobacteria bacterium]